MKKEPDPFVDLQDAVWFRWCYMFKDAILAIHDVAMSIPGSRELDEASLDALEIKLAGNGRRKK